MRATPTAFAVAACIARGRDAARAKSRPAKQPEPPPPAWPVEQLTLPGVIK